MNERFHESLSALLDGEADELEIRRLLKQTEQDEELLEKWGNYQMIGALMRQEPVAPVDLAKGVRQALNGQPMDELSPMIEQPLASNTWRKLAASGAVAASVMVAVLVGVQWQQGTAVDASQPVMVAQAPTTASEITTSIAGAPATMAVALSSEQQQQLEEAQRKLQEYVLRHNEQGIDATMQPMLPFMQTVRFNQEGEARR